MLLSVAMFYSPLYLKNIEGKTQLLKDGRTKLSCFRLSDFPIYLENIGFDFRFLGGFDSAHAAARTYDRAAIKFCGVDADINFNVTDYDDDIKQMSNFTKEEFVHILRRQSNGLSRGISKYRRATLHKCGRWEARKGQSLVKKACDKAVIKWIESEAVINFESSSCERELIYKAGNEDGNQNVGLNLGIVPPYSSGRQKEKLNNFELSASRLSKAQLPRGCSVVTFKHPSVWSSANFRPLRKERAIEKNMETDDPLPNSSRTIQGPHGDAVQIPPFSAAASSGFPSTETPSFADGQINFSIMELKANSVVTNKRFKII